MQQRKSPGVNFISGAIKHTQPQPGITLVEFSIALFVVVLIFGTATPAYLYLVDKGRTDKAVDEIKEMQRDVDRFRRKNNRYPDILTEIYPGLPIDPWGNPYQYLNIKNAPLPGAINPRTDNNFIKLNVDYDLFSEGADTESLSPIGASDSRDDIIRGKNGDFVGLAIDY